MTRLADIGIAGLGAMGRNLALHAIEAGLDIAVHDGWAEARAAWVGGNKVWERDWPPLSGR